ncbi:MAG: hypothetical protein ABIH26_05715 [Candidatus Eisenbacteria bacterium]
MKSRSRVAIIGGLILAAVFVLPRFGATADEGGDKKLQKQISIMEKILDEALVDSENALVKSTHPTRGVYLDGYGFVFTMELGIVDDQFRWESLSKLLDIGEGYSIEREEKKKEGETVITIKKKKADDEKKKQEQGEKKKTVDDEERWSLVKKELVEVIRDYGDTIARAKPTEWFTIFATPLMGSWGAEKTERLLIRVQMKEITDYNEGKLDEREFEKRVRITES